MNVAALPRVAAAAAAPTLSFHRLRAGTAHAPLYRLGARTLSADDASLPLLHPAGSVADLWCASAVAPVQQRGPVRYSTDEHWLYGSVELDDRRIDGGLQAATQQAYAALFDVLADGTCPHLLRLWNYLPDINVDDGSGERYRQFNAGRQQAFIDAQCSALDGAPAACALGSTAGGLRVQFLAGRAAPLAIENPLQVSAYHYPIDYGPSSPTFSRAAVADAGGGRQVLLISGTASIVGHASVHAGDVRRQTQQTLDHIDALCGEAASRCGAGFAACDLACTIYLRHAEDLPAVRDLFERHLGPASRAATEALYVRADVCRAELLVEIEAHGFAPCTDLVA